MITVTEKMDDLSSINTTSSLSSSQLLYQNYVLSLASHVLNADDRISNEVNRIKECKELPLPPSEPKVPTLCNGNINDKQRIYMIQKFIESFEYNYTGKPFIQMKKSRGSVHIQTCAKQIIKAALPIQCVEAVFLGAYLSSGMKEFERVPISFKSKFKDGVHRHIVLAIRTSDSKWGSIGISRRSNLMNKQFNYDTLASLIKEYEDSYESVYHRLLTVYIGLPLPHDLFSDQPLKWRAIKVRLYKNDPILSEQTINSFASNMDKMNEYYKREGVLPDNNATRKEGVPKLGRARSYSSSDDSTSAINSKNNREIM